jgi:hypothetical protein
MDWHEVQNSLHDTSFGLVFMALVLFMLASFVRAMRWKVLFISERISIKRLFVIQNEGIGLNNVMPIRIASEAAQMAVLTMRHNISGAKALAILSMERIVDLLASSLIIFTSLLLIPELESFKTYLWVAIGGALACIFAIRFMAWGSGRIGWMRRILFLKAFAFAVRQLEREKRRLVVSFLLSIAYWAIIGVTAWLIALAVKLPITPDIAMVTIMGAIFFSTAVPAAPSAIGTFEWAVIGALGLFGIAREEAFAFALITHAAFFLPPTIIAAICLPREKIFTMRNLRGLAARGMAAKAAQVG